MLQVSLIAITIRSDPLPDLQKMPFSCSSPGRPLQLLLGHSNNPILFQSCQMKCYRSRSAPCMRAGLIGKSAATKDATTPSNFRPIALTSCTGKLFTTILKNRWLEHMLDNGYLNRSIQKAFMTATPGCTEHNSKLATILSEARRKHKSLLVSWLDLANAYGSVNHTLIQFAMQHYHTPPQLCLILESLYSIFLPPF